VDVNLTKSFFGYFPLYYGSCSNRVNVVKWLIALRGEELDLEKKASFDGKSWTTPLEIARELKFAEISSLLRQFTANRKKIQFELREELGLPGSRPSELFALIVFLCDDLLKIKQRKTQTAATKFFAIAASLPMELQMVLCHRVVGSKKDNILSRDSELSFKKLAKVLSQ